MAGRSGVPLVERKKNVHGQKKKPANSLSRASFPRERTRFFLSFCLCPFAVCSLCSGRLHGCSRADGPRHRLTVDRGLHSTTVLLSAWPHRGVETLNILERGRTGNGQTGLHCRRRGEDASELLLLSPSRNAEVRRGNFTTGSHS